MEKRAIFFLSSLILLFYSIVFVSAGWEISTCIDSDYSAEMTPGGNVFFNDVIYNDRCSPPDWVGNFYEYSCLTSSGPIVENVVPCHNFGKCNTQGTACAGNICENQPDGQVCATCMSCQNQVCVNDNTLTCGNGKCVEGMCINQNDIYCEDKDDDGFGVCPHCGRDFGCWKNGNDCDDNNKVLAATGDNGQCLCSSPYVDCGGQCVIPECSPALSCTTPTSVCLKYPGQEGICKVKSTECSTELNEVCLFDTKPTNFLLAEARAMNFGCGCPDGMIRCGGDPLSDDCVLAQCQPDTCVGNSLCSVEDKDNNCEIKLQPCPEDRPLCEQNVLGSGFLAGCTDKCDEGSTDCGNGVCCASPLVCSSEGGCILPVEEEFQEGITNSLWLIRNISGGFVNISGIAIEFLPHGYIFNRNVTKDFLINGIPISAFENLSLIYYSDSSLLDDYSYNVLSSLSQTIYRDSDNEIYTDYVNYTIPRWAISQDSGLNITIRKIQILDKIVNTTCVDWDNRDGFNSSLFNSNYVIKSNINHFDSCQTNQSVKEYYCGIDLFRWDFWNAFSDKVVKSTIRECEFGCFNGACLSLSLDRGPPQNPFDSELPPLPPIPEPL